MTCDAVLGCLCLQNFSECLVTLDSISSDLSYLGLGIKRCGLHVHISANLSDNNCRFLNFWMNTHGPRILHGQSRRLLPIKSLSIFWIRAYLMSPAWFHWLLLWYCKDMEHASGRRRGGWCIRPDEYQVGVQVSRHNHAQSSQAISALISRVIELLS